MQITKHQIKMIHTLLNNHRLMKYKREIIASYTDGRTESSREMTREEAQYMINRLAAEAPLQRMRRKVFALAREMGMIWGETKEDNRMNAAKINRFLKSRGAVKKPLNKLKYEELQQVVSQFQSMAKKEGKRAFGRELKQVLTESGINQPKRQNVK